MELFPAIDILDNKVVRLKQGKYDAVTVYHDNPLEQAQIFAGEGATWVHIVDLEGARSGVPTQLSTIATIVKDTGLKVEVGGGVRSLATIEQLAEAGASRIVLGTSLAQNPELAAAAVERYGDLLCAGVDALNGEVAVQGWQEGSGQSAEQLVLSLKNKGYRHLVYTDINRDGMQTGIDAEAYKSIAASAGFAVTASGGISTLEDIHALAELGTEVIEAIIVGRAIYEQSFTVAQALAVLNSYR
ncbi:MAG: 1-(5-phosphoribosyl)-5-[(5-phosphoribosylamino)methylideneamino]imidazole-4-carboxamide isomerase [Coriobacteriia bacterium]|nr:1-(5-phosphoribosyl)-5-[(5-phosphoribosylamino)methylideneamino]imidazole-4-carboxamide isomerase [Coriobacteriia bacterium]MCL2749911.1 1-(5-phosphoribosyl)-5-[(5-phosphoribosylamino)methylideneamino]imidazole-4-carboxamide isomerase [Coriobacteriia bacterium]